MTKRSKLYVLDPEGYLFKQFSKKDIEKLNITFARKLDTLLTRANMKIGDALLVDSENVSQWENGKSLSDQLPNGMKVFATTVDGGQVIKVGNPIDITKLYKKIDEENSFIGQFLDEEPDRVRRQQSLDSVLNIKDKNRYKNMDNIIATINDQEIDEIPMKEWNDPNKDLEIELDKSIEPIDTAATISVDQAGDSSIEMNAIDISDYEDVDIPFELDIDSEDDPIDNQASESLSDEESSPLDNHDSDQIGDIDVNKEIETETSSSKSKNSQSFESETVTEQAQDLEPELSQEDTLDSGLEEETEIEEIDLEAEGDLEPEQEVVSDTEPELDLESEFDSDTESSPDPDSVKVPIPYRVIEERDLSLKEGERLIEREGSDGWVENGEYVEPIDEIVKVGPNKIEEVPFDTEYREVTYIQEGHKEVIRQGEPGIQADGVIIKESITQIVLKGVAGEEPEDPSSSVKQSEKDNLKSDDNDDQPQRKKKRRRRRKRKSDYKKNDQPKDSPKGETIDAVFSDFMPIKEEDPKPRLSILDENEDRVGHDDLVGDDLDIELDDDLITDHKSKDSKTSERSFLDSLLGDDHFDLSQDEQPSKATKPKTNIDDLLKRLEQGGDR